jgi:4-amino-4-deoxy-L-arabinose transferase-like glycosyltransferase
VGDSSRSGIGTALLRGMRFEPTKLLFGLVGLVASAFVVQLLRIAAARLAYPFELEWMEGALVDHVRIVLAGEPLYREPSIEFTPFIYTPFYYWVCATLSRVFGVGFLVPRLVSLLAAAGNMVLIAALVGREGAGRLAVVVGIGLFAATYGLSGCWMDLARVDSLFVFLFLSGVYLARHGESMRAAVGCGAMLSLAFLTKQTGLVLAVPVLLGAIALHRRRGLVAASVFALLVVGAVFWMNHRTQGWFSYYVFEVPRQHSLRTASWRALLIDACWRPLVVPLLLAAFALASADFATEGRHRSVVFLYAGVLASTFVMSWAALLHEDGFANVLMPYHAALAVVGGIGVGRIVRATGGAATPLGARWQGVAMVALLAHFGSLAYDRRPSVPSRRDVEAGNLMLAKLAAREGPVLMLGTGYYGSLAQHPEINAHTMALTDIFKTGDRARNEVLLGSLTRAIASKRFKTIVVDQSYAWLPPEVLGGIRGTYRQDDELFPASEPALTASKTGFITRPQSVWVPKTP